MGKEALKDSLLIRTLGPAVRDLKGISVDAGSGNAAHDEVMRRYLDCWAALHAAGRFSDLLLDAVGLDFATPEQREAFVRTVREPVDAFVDRLAETILDAK